MSQPPLPPRDIDQRPPAPLPCAHSMGPSDDYVRPRSDQTEEDGYQPLPSFHRLDVTDEVDDAPVDLAPPPPKPRSRSVSVAEPPKPQLITPTSSRHNSRQNLNEQGEPPPLPNRPSNLPNLRQRKTSLPNILPSGKAATLPTTTPNTQRLVRRIGVGANAQPFQPLFEVPNATIPEHPAPPLPSPCRGSFSSASSPSGESMRSLDSRGSFSDRISNIPDDNLPYIPEATSYDPVYTDTVASSGQQLENFIWFHSDITDRNVANNRLRNLQVNGAFLIRPRGDNTEKEPYALHLYQMRHNKIHILKIRRRPDRLFALGNPKHAEKAFASLPDLVEFHRYYPLKLEGHETDEIYLADESPDKP